MKSAYLAPTAKMATGISSPRPSTKASQSRGQCRASNKPPPPITKPLKWLTCVWKTEWEENTRAIEFRSCTWRQYDHRYRGVLGRVKKVQHM